MTSLLEQKKAKKPALSNAQKTFNRLKKKIQGMEYSLRQAQKFLDEALSFYHEQLLPAKKKKNSLLTICIKIFYDFYNNSSDLSTKERQALHQLMLEKIREVCSSTQFKNADPEIVSILKEIEGVDYAQEVSSDLADLKEEMQEMFKENGVEIDLSAINAEDDEQEIMRKMFEAMSKSREEMLKNEPPPKQKTKRQIEKERKAEEFENLQKRSLSTIYKQLAKALHPDLEQDLILKAEKEALMKKLTVAYENDDLHTLLSLEFEWMNHSESDASTRALRSDEQLKIYNSILTEQVKELETEHMLLNAHSRYVLIHDYCTDIHTPPLFPMQYDLMQINSACKLYESTAKDLKSKNAKKILRQILRMYQE